MQAVLEESRANHAALLASSPLLAPENSCPNNSTGAATATAGCPAAQPAAQAAAAIPEARQTVHISSSYTALQAAGGRAPAADQEADGTQADAADSDDKCSASQASDDSTEDCLEALD